MIEFVIKNRRLRLDPDGIFYIRHHCRGKETIAETWKEVKFSKHLGGYLTCSINLNGKPRRFLKHRLVYFAHHQEWDIFDTSTDNYIDHFSRVKTDNSKENLRKLTDQENHFNTDAKGYCWDKSRNKWLAYIQLDYKFINLGRFEKEEDARKAYVDAKKKYHIIS